MFGFGTSAAAIIGLLLLATGQVAAGVALLGLAAVGLVFLARATRPRG